MLAAILCNEPVPFKSGTGGIDPHERRGIIKPTGLGPPKKAKPEVQRRLDETREIHREVSEQFIRELGQDREFKPIAQMSMQEIDAEIGELLRKKLRTDEEELMLLMLMVAVTT